MSPSQSGDPQTRAVATVEAFVLRARRVCAHSLVSDPDALASLISPKWHVVVNEQTGKSTVTRYLPPEEPVESLAARVRPLILQQDPVHWGKVLNALGLLLRDRPDTSSAMEYLQWLRGQWGGINSGSDAVRAYSVQKGRVDGEGPTSDISDNSLAFAWFYGDVVHADTARRDAARDFTVVDRFEAAVHVVARVAWLTHATLDFIKQLREQGALETDGRVFDEDVVVAVTEITREAKVFVAPVDTPQPGSLHDGLSGDWKPLMEMRTEMASPTDGVEAGADDPGATSPPSGVA